MESSDPLNAATQEDPELLVVQDFDDPGHPLELGQSTLASDSPEATQEPYIMMTDVKGDEEPSPRPIFRTPNAPEVHTEEATALTAPVPTLQRGESFSGATVTAAAAATSNRAYIDSMLVPISKLVDRAEKDPTGYPLTLAVESLNFGALELVQETTADDAIAATKLSIEHDNFEYFACIAARLLHPDLQHPQEMPGLPPLAIIAAYAYSRRSFGIFMKLRSKVDLVQMNRDLLVPPSANIDLFQFMFKAGTSQFMRYCEGHEDLLDQQEPVLGREGKTTTALITATKHRLYHKMIALVRAGASIDLPDSHGKTPLLKALRNNDTMATAILVFMGASLDRVLHKPGPMKLVPFETPVSEAIGRSANVHLARLLIGNGCLLANVMGYSTLGTLTRVHSVDALTVARRSGRSDLTEHLHSVLPSGRLSPDAMLQFGKYASPWSRDRIDGITEFDVPDFIMAIKTSLGDAIDWSPSL